jgi:hypothetical protein
MQSVPRTTKVVSSNPVHGEMYPMQHFVIKFVSDLRQGFLRELRFTPPITLTATISQDGRFQNPAHQETWNRPGMKSGAYC